MRKKAELLLGGDVKALDGTPLPFGLSRSTAGPGAGRASLVLSFEGCRAKKPLSDGGGFELSHDGTSYRLTRDGEPFLENVSLEPAVFHSPKQAFFNLDQRCALGCAYCASPRLPRETAYGIDPGEIVSMLSGAMERKEVRSFAVTSGVPDTVAETVARLACCAIAVRNAFPDLPIGVEAYVDDKTQINSLRAAGADEIKINVEAASREIFERVCPGKDYDTVLDMLSHAVSVFGKGRVASNVIVGMGESMKDVGETLDLLTAMGVCPGVRPLSVDETNAGPLGDLGIERTLDAETLVSIAYLQKRAMERNGLDPRTFSTMCFECGCCDLVPFKDF